MGEGAPRPLKSKAKHTDELLDCRNDQLIRSHQMNADSQIRPRRCQNVHDN
ncbi:Hypothetical predicted protein [Podarcis lilfordi]|uniref:Uncharacterized protein n=1 Tax=Podarcis lilfordi TaxID=74358 RepID=A0AA35KQY5_9SAUR|nr:Hypothetical predicted protein [Podarcis lilfordi]